MLTGEPQAYARSRQVELTRSAGDVRLTQKSQARPRPVAGIRQPSHRWLASRLRLRPAAPAASC
jgi:hypothetical protein